VYNRDRLSVPFFCQVLTGKYPWSEVQADAAVVLRLSQGLKPSRPLIPPIDDQHWAFIQQCWSPVPERPLAKDVVSSLQQLLETCTPLPPLRELFRVPTPSLGVPNCRRDDDLPFPSFGDACDCAEESSCEHRNLWGMGTKRTHEHLAEDPVSQKRPATGPRVTNAPSDSTVISKWVHRSLLGRGTYGSVYLALDTSTGKMFAVKQVEKGNGNTERLNFVPELMMEREILSRLHHRHIVAYLGSEETTSFLSMYVA